MAPSKIPRGPAGVVYLVTSPCMTAVKVGMWRSDIASLRRRYATVYGPDLTLETKEVGNARGTEALVHSRFSQHRLGRSELFDKAFLEDYSAFLKSPFKLVPVLRRRRPRESRCKSPAT